MSKSIALAAFNAAVIATNAVHATKRGVVKAASVAKDATVAGATTTKEVGVAFWAGLKYANEANKVQGSSAERLKAEDIAPQAEPEAAPAPEAKPKARKPRAKAAKADVTDVEVKAAKA